MVLRRAPLKTSIYSDTLRVTEDCLIGFVSFKLERRNLKREETFQQEEETSRKIGKMMQQVVQGRGREKDPGFLRSMDSLEEEIGSSEGGEEENWLEE